MKNPTLVIFDTAFGYGASYSIKAGRDLTEKEMRKWWRHYADKAPDYVGVGATYENEDGEAVDITAYWVMHECAKYSEAHDHIFN